MVDLKNLSDKELRELLMKYEDNPPPVNANTRTGIESTLRRIMNINTPNNTVIDESQNEISNADSISGILLNSTPERTPPMVRFESQRDTKHEYEREYTPSYCRKSLNDYRDKNYDSPKFNLLDKPGNTPHINKHGKKPSTSTKSSSLTGILMLILVFVAIVIGVYFLLTWDPSFSNPLTSN